MVPLSELVVIENGLQVRPLDESKKRKVKDVKNHVSFLNIQAANIDSLGVVDFTEAKEMTAGFKDTDRLSLRPGDLVTVNRGEGMRTGLVTKDPPMLAIPAYSLHRLTIHSPARVDERYLWWYLNRPIVRKRMAALNSGQTIPVLTRKAFAEFKIELPPIEKQRKIGECALLLTEERRLIDRLSELRQQALEHLLTK